MDIMKKKPWDGQHEMDGMGRMAWDGRHGTNALERRPWYEQHGTNNMGQMPWAGRLRTDGTGPRIYCPVFDSIVAWAESSSVDPTTPLCNLGEFETRCTIVLEVDSV